MSNLPAKTSAQTPAQAGDDSATPATSKKGWKWTPKKREAIRLLLQGKTYKAIAKKLGYNEKTIRRWRQTPEFHAELLTKAREYADQHQYKRAFETGLLTDQLATMAASKMAAITEEDGGPGQVDINELQLYLREYREFKDSEKTDFGIDPRGRAGSGGGVHVNVGIGVGSGAPPGSDTGAKGSESFKSFIEANLGKVPQRVISDAKTPQQALLGIAEALVEETDVIEELYEEDMAMAEVIEGAKK